MDILLWALAILLMIVGLAGVVVPVLPGTPFVFMGMLIAAWLDQFQRVGVFTLSFAAVLMLLAIGVDFVAASLGAKRAGASTMAITGASLGTFVGLFLGIPGILLGPFVGAAAGEIIARRDTLQAAKVGLATWLALALAIAAKLALTFTMLGLFIAAYALG
ncbi:MAG: DUF456 family protein [Rhodocyclaceae bacterium]|nr:DUF456 family protein [Rhodocyclaceae bacterium]MBX3671242.1 DUF456 family protein [Rhodocyclaceae bacterium]